MFDWFLRFALCGGEWWVIFIFWLRHGVSCQLSANSSEHVIHAHRVKGGNDLTWHRIWQTSSLLPHELKNRGTKWEVFWENLKVINDKFTWNGLQISCVGIYGGRFGKTGFKDFGCTSSIPAQYRWRLAKDWEATTRRAILVIIMLCDKTILNKA